MSARISRSSSEPAPSASSRTCAARALARIAASGWLISWARAADSSPTIATRPRCASSRRCSAASRSAARRSVTSISAPVTRRRPWGSSLVRTAPATQRVAPSGCAGDGPFTVERRPLADGPLEGGIQRPVRPRPHRVQEGANRGLSAWAQAQQAGARLGDPDPVAAGLPGPEPDAEGDTRDRRARLALSKRGLRSTSHTTLDQQRSDQGGLQQEHADREEDGRPVALPLRDETVPHDGAGREPALIDPPATQLPPVEHVGAHRPLDRGDGRWGSAGEKPEREAGRLLAVGIEAVQVPTDDAAAEVLVQEPIDRRVGACARSGPRPRGERMVCRCGRRTSWSTGRRSAVGGAPACRGDRTTVGRPGTRPRPHGPLR